jgi:hypothetical protein
MVRLDRLYVHNDAVYKIDKPSGLDGVPLYSIDADLVEKMLTDEIQNNVNRSSTQRLKEMGL